jgi:adenosylcobinamide-GDP ribazoletransferase
MRRALSFLTLFGRASAPNETTMAWFPLVGALLGSAIGVLWWLVAKAWPPLIAAAVVVVADLVLTGGLHFDGLADAGDGLLAPLSKERRLQAMSDPAIGAFGALSIAAVLLVRFGALSGLRPAPLVLGGLWCASRTSMVVIAETLPYARANGIVRSFLGTSPRSARQRVVVLVAIALGLLLATGLVVLGRGVRGIWALLGELAAMGAVAMFSWRRVGGFTGDVLGAAGVVGETVGLLILVAR